MSYDPICRVCRLRPVMDRCDICEECWYAPPSPQHDIHCHDYQAATASDHCICGAAALGSKHSPQKS